MHEINGINISDINYDKVCLNCRYWQTNTQLTGAANGVICIKNNRNTAPNDSCALFSANLSADSLQNPNGIHDKRHKMSVWKR